MKLLFTLLTGQGKKRKTIEEYKEEMVERFAKEQFKQLAEKGLSVPVALL